MSIDESIPSTVLASETENTISQITLRRITYKLNDFVFLKPETEDECYYIGRIIEFIPDKDAKDFLVNIKVAWFSRPRDVFGGNRRRHFDPRLLIATMNTDINPVSAIICKCEIKHIDHISNMDKYKSDEYAFYYNQLYDRHTRRLYDVLPMESVKNLPRRIMRHLLSFQFILVEAGSADRFTTKRVCQACDGWCSPDEPIATCGTCSNILHLDCAGMTRKPSKGYTWQCSSCLRDFQMNERGASNDDLDSTNGQSDNSNHDEKDTPSKLKKATPIDFDADEVDDHVAAHTHNHNPLFPFCYFGKYASLNDLDDNLDEKSHPKSSSRIGKAFQAHMPECCDTTLLDAESKQIKAIDNLQQEPTLSVRRRGRPRISSTDTTVSRSSVDEVVFCGHTLTEKSIDAGHYLRLLSELGGFKNLSGRIVYQCLLQLYQNRSRPDEDKSWLNELVSQERSSQWTVAEISSFERGVAKYGHELNWIRKEFVPSRTLKEVILYFYIWKKSPNYTSVYSEYCRVYRPKKFLKNTDVRSSAAANIKDFSDFSSTEEDNVESLKPTMSWVECSNCFKNAKVTRPAGLLFAHGQQQRWCLECHTYYITYATPRIISETIKKANREKERKRKAREMVDEDTHVFKKRGRPPGRSQLAKKNNTEETWADISDKLDDAELEPCAVCLDFTESEASKLVRCTGCRLYVHTLCYGVLSFKTSKSNSFQCDRCMNSQNPESSLIYDCVLCTGQLSSRLSPIKRTICNNWVHVQCAIWHSEPIFGCLKSLEPVESIGLVDKQKWLMHCNICNIHAGACVKCTTTGCLAASHVTCAQHDDSWVAKIQTKTIPDVKDGWDYSTIVTCPLHSSKNENENNLAGSSDATTSEILFQYISGFKVGISGHATRSQRRAASQTLHSQCYCHDPCKENISISQDKSIVTQHIDSLPQPTPYLEKTSSTNNNPLCTEDPLLDTAKKTSAENGVSIEEVHCVMCNVSTSPFWFCAEDLLLIKNSFEESLFASINAKGARVCFACVLQSKSQLVNNLLV
ncbi:putative PHD type zinc finger protein with BAH domain-containing protein [Batrachochytrium dendrobatidis]